ncbi:hypothetical protein Tco_0064248 [Tanacetum coccineum]
MLEIIDQWIGMPTQVCVRSCPNISAPASRPFSRQLNTAYPLPSDTAYPAFCPIQRIHPNRLIRLRMTKVIKGEFEKIKDVKVEDVSLTCDTPLEVFNKEVSRLSGMDNELFTYEVEVTNIPCNSKIDDDSESIKLMTTWDQRDMKLSSLTSNHLRMKMKLLEDLSVTYIACAALNGIKMGDKTLTDRRANQEMSNVFPENRLKIVSYIDGAEMSNVFSAR